MCIRDRYKQALNTIEESDEIIADGSDKDFVELAKIEKNEAIEKIPGLEEELKILLIPKDPAAVSYTHLDVYKRQGENVLWSNSMFGGMPTYTYYIPKNNNYVSKIQDGISSVVGKPASFLFMAMLCFYILMSAFKMNRWLAVGGSIACLLYTSRCV